MVDSVDLLESTSKQIEVGFDGSLPLFFTRPNAALHVVLTWPTKSKSLSRERG